MRGRHLLGGLLAAGLVLVAWAGLALAQGQPPPPPPARGDVEAGRQLFEVGCSSCHGLDGRGSERGPSLVGVGAASADFYLSTGRMPMDRADVQPQRTRVAYSAREIRQLTAYVASLGPGPPIPKVDPEHGKLAEGGELYANHCASCHSSAGAGGALGHASYAPPLDQATPTQVAEAIRMGPGTMPRFGPDVLDDEQVASVVRYVEYLRHPEDRGGLGLGHLGPIPEGFVGWVVGLGLILLATRWIGTRD